MSRVNWECATPGLTPVQRFSIKTGRTSAQKPRFGRESFVSLPAFTVIVPIAAGLPHLEVSAKEKR